MRGTEKKREIKKERDKEKVIKREREREIVCGCGCENERYREKDRKREREREIKFYYGKCQSAVFCDFVDPNSKGSCISLKKM